jgi:membrane protease YdiL (CAAX protease family)
MSRITFLDNAQGGKNNWWRYLLTIILTFGGSTLLGIVILIPISILTALIAISANDPNYVHAFFSNPLFELLMNGISYMLFFLLFYLGIRFIHKRKFISLINTVSKVDWRRILKGASLWSIILGIGTLISLIIYPNSFKVTFNPNTFIILLILSLMVFPVQASFEELFFRGYLMQGIGLLTKKPVIPLLITSTVFAVIHYWNGTDALMSVDIVLQVFIIGITLGIITLGENRLETAMGVHIANNLFVAIVVNTSNGGFTDLPSILTTYGAPNLMVDVPALALSALALIVIVFWNKKDDVYNIFRDRIDIEIDRVEVNEI